MELKDKYIFRPYDPDFPELFEKEKGRLQKTLGAGIQIQHIGSTAVPGLGGKGIVDILLVAPKNDWPGISEKLRGLGYEYKKKEPEREREKLFFMALPYHIHLTYPESIELKRSLGFRDYLRTHPEEAEEYAEIKRKAAEEAQKFSTKDEMRDTYTKRKEAFIQKIMLKFDHADK